MWGNGLSARQTHDMCFVLWRCLESCVWAWRGSGSQLGNPNSILLCNNLFLAYGISELMYSATWCVCLYLKARCTQVNVWWANGALGKRNKNSLHPSLVIPVEKPLRVCFEKQKHIVCKSSSVRIVNWKCSKYLTWYNLLRLEKVSSLKHHHYIFL